MKLPAVISITTYLFGTLAVARPVLVGRSAIYQDIVLKDFKWVHGKTMIDFDIWFKDDDAKPKHLSECRIRTSLGPRRQAKCEDPTYTVWFAQNGFNSTETPFVLEVTHLSRKARILNFRGNFVIQPRVFECKDCLVFPEQGLRDYGDPQAMGDWLNHIGLRIADIFTS